MASITSVADATVVQEHPSLFRTWWTNINLQYDFVMGTILIILNLAAYLYMKHHKIPFTASTSSLTNCIILYLLSGTMSFMTWFAALLGEEDAYDMYIVGRICHIFGFAILLHILYSISPPLALGFGIPCSLWFLAAFIGTLYELCRVYIFEECRDCWKIMNEPQVRVVNV